MSAPPYTQISTSIIEQKRVELAKKIDMRQILLIIVAVISSIFFALAVLCGVGQIDLRPLHYLDLIVIGILILVGPYGFYMSVKYARIRDIEKRLPDFLRDVAEAGRFGMTLADSIIVASAGRYGKLTPEIKKMAAQIKWGVPATEALRLFAERVDTPMTNKITAIIIKSSEAGGNVADVLGMVAHATKEDLLTREERKIAMSTYVAVVYIAFFVFLVTIIILAATFLPKMEEAGMQISEKALEEEAPGGTVGLVRPEYVPSICLALVVSAMVHAVGDGILAGVIESGKIEHGLRHSFIMLLIGYLILRFALKPEYLLGITGGGTAGGG